MITAAERHELARQFERAKQLAGKTPPDFAGVHRILSESCTLDPGNTLFVQALLENLRRAKGKTATAWPWQVWQRRAELEKAIRSRHWTEALPAGWWLLGERPREARVLSNLAQICAALDHGPTQILLLQAARELAPREVAVLRPLAWALGATGQFTGAAMIWQELLSQIPADSEATSYLHVLSESQTSRQLSAGDLMTHLKELLADKQWDAAEHLLASKAGAEGANLELREIGEEIMLGRARERTEIARRLAKLSTTSAQQRLVAEMLAEQRRIELGVAFARYERFPSEAASSWELAGCLTRVANFSEALKYLLPLQSLAEWRVQAVVAAGENYQHLRQFERALQCYREALNEPQLDLQSEHGQLAWYRGAVLAEATGAAGDALAWLEQLVAANSGYKDAATRLDNLRLICNKGGFSAQP